MPRPRSNKRLQGPAGSRGEETAPQRERDQEVLDAAAGIFARKGYSAATVQDVADELGILKGSLYHYIRTKEDLLFRLLEQIHAEVDELLDEVRAIEDLGPVDRLAEYVRIQVIYNLRNSIRISVYYNDVDHLSEDRHREVVRLRRVHERFVENLVREAQEAGAISVTKDPKLLTNMIFAVVIWPYRWFRPKGRVSVETVASACVDFILSGVGAPLTSTASTR